MPAPGGVNANIFALLDDDDNDDEGAPVQQKAPAAKPAAKKEEVKKPERERKPKDDRRKGGGKGDREEKSNAPYDGSDKPAKPSDTEGRGKGRSRRYEDGEGGKGGERRKGGKGKGASRGREFDRHSQGGKGKGEAREGRGKYNWGEKTEGAPAEGENAEAAEGADGEKAPATEEAAPEPEEEENTMSYDEYLKAQAEKGRVGPVLVERKISESEKPEGSALNSRDMGGQEDGMYGMIFSDYDGKHDKRGAKQQREGWVNSDDVLNMKFADPNKDAGKGGGGKGDRPERRSKGGKNGGKGDAPRGGGRGAPQQRRPAQAGGKIELDDANAFPSLA